MLLILLLSLVITPPTLWLLLYNRVTDQYNEDEKVIRTKKEAQKEIRRSTLRYHFFHLWLIYTTAACILLLHCYHIINLTPFIKSLG